MDQEKGLIDLSVPKHLWKLKTYFSENSQRNNFEINGSELNMRRQNFREAMEHIVAATKFESLAPTTLRGASRNI
uniref:Uncharacterized protein n=1 Tax=Glossina pallidipes TaxID=7398 RepID=A0A1A9ZED3_GLOPL